MTIIYKPVKIETAAQAEALPVGTLAVNWEIPSAAVRIGPDDADGYPWLVNSQNLGWHSDIVGHTAFVPIEAEEETRAFYDSKRGTTIRVPVDDRAREKGRVETRLVTPWDAA